MPRKITLESIIDKIEDKEFFYVSENDVKLDITIETALFLRDANIILKNDRLSPFKDARSLYELESTQEDIANKYQLDTQRVEQLRELYQLYFNIDTPVLRKQFKHLTKEQLAQLNKQAKNIDFALKLFLTPVNGKDNFYTIVTRNKVLYPADVWRKAMYKAFVEDGNGVNLPEDKQALFDTLKEYLLLEFDGLKASAKAVEELQALTFKEVTDRHRKIVKPKIEKVYTEQKDIARIAHCEILDLISSLNKIEEKENFLGERIVLWENEKLRAYITVPPEVNKRIVGKFGVFTDKLLVEARIRLCEECNINYKGDFTISIPIHVAMVNFGYTPEQAENKDYRHLFIQKVTPYLDTLYSASIEEKANNSTTKFRVLSYFSTKGALTLTFTGAFMSLQSKAHTFEYVLRDIAKQIPEKRIVEYYIARKLVNNATNKTNIAKGREDLLSVQALFDDLNSKGVLAGGDTTAHAEKRKIERFLDALNWLINEEIVDIQFLDKNKHIVTPKDMEYYKQNITSLKELMLDYIVLKLADFIEDNRPKYEIDYDIRQARATEEAKKKRARIRRQAQKQAQQEQEQEQEQQQPEQNASPFLDMLDALPKS